jgi:hypothetical protein
VHSRERASSDPGELAYKSGPFKRWCHPDSYEPGRYASDGHDWTPVICRR